MAGAARAPSARTPWRDNLEALTIAIVMAVMLKYFIVEAYKIPTGSMQPTLMGNDDDAASSTASWSTSSRTTSATPSASRSWSSSTRSTARRTSSSASCGMPGEELKIDRGDLWTRPDASSDWSVLRRPRARACTTSGSALDLALGSGLRAVEGRRRGGGGLELLDGTVEATAAGAALYVGHGGADPGGSIVDTYVHGYPQAIRDARRATPTAPIAVGDLRVDGPGRAPSRAAPPSRWSSRRAPSSTASCFPGRGRPRAARAHRVGLRRRTGRRGDARLRCGRGRARSAGRRTAPRVRRREPRRPRSRSTSRASSPASSTCPRST